MCFFFKICPEYQWHNGICESTNKMIDKGTRSVEPLSLLPTPPPKNTTYHTHAITIHDVNPRSTKWKRRRINIHHHISQQTNWCNSFRVFCFSAPILHPFSLHPSYDPPASETDRLRTLLRSVATSRKRHRFRSLVSWVVARPAPNQRDVAA